MCDGMRNAPDVHRGRFYLAGCLDFERDIAQEDPQSSIKLCIDP
jgi:hypothetical protein